MKKQLKTFLPYTAILAGMFLAYGGGRMVSVRPQGASASSRLAGGAEPTPSLQRADHTGMAPDCSLSLVTMFAGTAATGHSRASGVPVEVAKNDPGPRELRVTGRVEADENRIHILRAGADGWVTSLGKNPVGTVVKKDEVLATFFSNEYLRPQQAYLFALANLEGMQTRVSGPREQAEQAQSAVHAAEDALRLLGMSDPQIRELAVTQQTMEDIVLTAPVSGVVAARNLLREQNISSGDDLYRIMNLDRVWIFADLTPEQADRVKRGTVIRVRSHDVRSFDARVLSNVPFFDLDSQLSKVRLELSNLDMRLRPNMYVDIELQGQSPGLVSVPEAAILDTGLTKLVFVQTESGALEPRLVETGASYQGRTEIVSGLAKGERFVTSANFLIDSESRLRLPTCCQPADGQSVCQASDNRRGQEHSPSFR